MKKHLFKGALLLLSVLLALGVAAGITIGAEEPTPTLTVESYNLSYSDSVYLLYAVSATEVKNESDVQMLFWNAPQSEYLLGSESYSAKTSGRATVKGKDCLVFYSDGIAAKEMTDAIYARPAVTVDGSTYYGDVVRFSVLEYVYAARAKGDMEEADYALLTAMLDYGAAAQTALGYKTDRLANLTFHKITATGGVFADGFSTALALEGDVLTLTANARENGFYFSHWENAAGDAVSADEILSVRVEDADASFTAVYVSDCPHDYTETVTVAPTTFGTGSASYLCTRCGHSYTSTLPATNTLKVLAVGNSFSVDAMNHLYRVCKDAGIETVVLGNLHIGGCTLETHLQKMTDNEAAYTFYLSDPTEETMVSDSEKRTAHYGLTYTDWDFVTLQQGSKYSGMPTTYTYLDGVVDYINTYKPSDAKLYWHMTWAYQSDTAHSGFANYGNDQMTMYEAILSTVSSVILPSNYFDGVIPSGTAVQNLRTSYLGDTVTRDGYHMSYGIGRYTLSLTWLAALTGYDISTVDVIPPEFPEVETHLAVLREAAMNAIATPFGITPSTMPPVEEEREPLLSTTLSPLSDDDRAYLSANGLDPDAYLSLDLGWMANSYYDSSKKVTLSTPASGNSTFEKYLATQTFSRAELINGTVIRVDSGYQYRPEGFIDMNTLNSTDTRPANTSAAFTVIDDAWWGDFTVRGFNLSKKSGKIGVSESGSMKIYIPVAKRVSLSEEDKSYLSGKGLDPNDYMLLSPVTTLQAYYNSTKTNGHLGIADSESLKPQYFCMQILSRYDLTDGTVLRLESGYKVRPDAWTMLLTKTASDERPTTFTAAFTTVDSDWWGDFNYRGINVQRNDKADVTESDLDALRIYIKIA